jgi:hypothetical protein
MSKNVSLPKNAQNVLDFKVGTNGEILPLNSMVGQKTDSNKRPFEKFLEEESKKAAKLSGKIIDGIPVEDAMDVHNMEQLSAKLNHRLGLTFDNKFKMGKSQTKLYKIFENENKTNSKSEIDFAFKMLQACGFIKPLNPQKLSNEDKDKNLKEALKILAQGKLSPEVSGTFFEAITKDRESKDVEVKNFADKFLTNFAAIFEKPGTNPEKPSLADKLDKTINRGL